MDKVFPTIVVILLIVLMLIGMFFGWRARQKRQAYLATDLPVPDDTGSELFASELLYVATTIAGEPLNRVAVSGLGYRSRASIVVATGGITLSLDGEPDAFIPAQTLLGVSRAHWTIDRVVENGGLVVVNWMLGDTSVDSYLRLVDPPDPSVMIEAIQQIVVGVADQEGASSAKQ
ncbi:MAG: hypothetical protein ABI053_02740 [Lacisediminihabitans sp.]